MNHVLSELRQTDPFKGKPADYVRNGGFRIVTTVDKRVQDAAEAAADIRRDSAPQTVRGQPRNWQAALVAVEPGTGRVPAHYGSAASGRPPSVMWLVGYRSVARAWRRRSSGGTLPSRPVTRAAVPQP